MDLEQQLQAPQERPFKDYFSPFVNLNTSCIKYLNVATRSFELKPSVCCANFIELASARIYCKIH